MDNGEIRADQAQSEAAEAAPAVQAEGEPLHTGLPELQGEAASGADRNAHSDQDHLPEVSKSVGEIVGRRLSKAEKKRVRKLERAEFLMKWIGNFARANAQEVLINAAALMSDPRGPVLDGAMLQRLSKAAKDRMKELAVAPKRQIITPQEARGRIVIP